MYIGIGGPVLSCTAVSATLAPSNKRHVSKHFDVLAFSSTRLGMFVSEAQKVAAGLSVQLSRRPTRCAERTPGPAWAPTFGEPQEPLSLSLCVCLSLSLSLFVCHRAVGSNHFGISLWFNGRFPALFRPLARKTSTLEPGCVAGSMASLR